MAFVEIENLKPVSGLDAVPPEGLRLSARHFKAKHGVKQWIELKIGATLAKQLALTQPAQKVRLLFGADDDSGQIMLAVDNERGLFAARRDKQGRYFITIGAASADGLFALTFPVFTLSDVPVQRAPGCPPAITFAVSGAMLAVADD